MASAFVTPRYASRRSTTSHRHAVTFSDLAGPGHVDRNKILRCGQASRYQGGRDCRHPQRPAAGDQVAMPAQQRCRGDEEDRPACAGEESRQRRQHDTVGRVEPGTVYLPTEHRDLMAQHEEFDVLGAVVAGELGQHPQHLTQQHVHQRHVHARQRDSRRIPDLGQSRTSTGQIGFVSPTRPDRRRATLSAPSTRAPPCAANTVCPARPITTR
jgi:hypothetical protein